MAYIPETIIYDDDENEICNGKTLKLLGFHFSEAPTVAAHVEVLRKRVRRLYWTLYHLRDHGFSQDDLVAVFKSILRPVLDYCCSVYHPLLTDEQDEILERLQSYALRIIYGSGMSAGAMRKLAGLTTLRARRIELTDKFAKKALDSERFAHWFPRRAGRSTRNSEVYHEYYARCECLKNSPLFYMRRRFNNKPGKTYGVRNKQHREA